MTSFCEGARNGREMPTITYIGFHSPQERGLFQFTCEEFRVQISWSYWEVIVSQNSHTSSRERRKEGERVAGDLWLFVTLGCYGPW